MKATLPQLAGLSLLGTLALSASAAPRTAGDDGDWPQYHGGPAHDNARKGKLEIDNPTVAWHVEGAHGQPTLVGNDLYSGGKGLFHIDATTGEVLARVLVPEEGDEEAGNTIMVGYAPAITDTLVIARHGSGVVAWDRALGAQAWSWSPAGRASPWGFPGVLADGVFVCAAGTDVVALRATDGEELWTRSLGSPVNMVPAADAGRVFVGSARGEFVALSLTDGEELWSYGGDAEFGHTSPIVTDGKVVVGDRGIRGGRRGAINALDADTGELEWQTEFGATGLSTPGVAGKNVLAGFGRTVGFLSLKKGEWESKPKIRCEPNAFGSPTVVGKHLLYGNLDGNLYVHEVKNGKLAWQFRVPDAQVSDFVHARERLFVSTTQGLFALEDGKGSSKGNVLTWKGSVD